MSVRPSFGPSVPLLRRSDRKEEFTVRAVSLSASVASSLSPFGPDPTPFSKKNQINFINFGIDFVYLQLDQNHQMQLNPFSIIKLGYFISKKTEMGAHIQLVRKFPPTPNRKIIDLLDLLVSDIPTARAIRSIIGFMSVTKPENRRRVVEWLRSGICLDMTESNKMRNLHVWIKTGL